MRVCVHPIDQGDFLRDAEHNAMLAASPYLL
ncbi:hypothetical protein BCAR13_440106 [Paraburkholderia caribensis]|nr:hypothetical protein BCAR13_440106 [Paraburkholderia caribensis]